MKLEHSSLSYELVNNLETAIQEAFYATWEDLHAAVTLPEHPKYRLVAWGEEQEGKGKFFNLSLHQGLGESFKELFTAYALLDDGYESLLSTCDKMLTHFERSLEKPAEALHTNSAYDSFSKKIMQPLLDALNNNDFELAAALTPVKYRLCGYEEFEEDHLHQQSGFGWAGQFADTVVPAGRYPVFAEKYFYHEADRQFTNQLNDFHGIFIFLAGKCVADSVERPAGSYPYDNTVWESPYCHSVASAILDNKSSIHLLPPYKAVPVHFEYNGESHTTYKIVDTSLPERMKQNPMELRYQNLYIHKTVDLSQKATKLYDDFAREYCNNFGYSGCIPLNVLSHRDAYSPESLQELLDKNIIQRRECDGVAYELTAKERLDLFHAYRVGGREYNGLKWDAEYKKCCKEAASKEPLAKMIDAASRRVSVDDLALSSKEKQTAVTGPVR